MRIAQVCPYNFEDAGGVQTFVRVLSQGLIKRGHYVRIIAPKKDKKANCKIKELIHLGRSVRLPMNQSFFDASIVIGSIEDPIKKLLKQERFDIIHYHEPFIPSLAMQIITESTSTNILHFHAYPYRETAYYKLIKKICSPVENFIIDQADGLLAGSEYSAKFIKTITDKAIEIISYPVDLGTYNTKVKPIKKYKDGKFNILFLGRLDRRKGIEYLLEAYKNLCKGNNKFRLIICGKGNLEKDVRKYIRKNKLKNVDMVGFVKEEDKQKYFASCDIYCSPAIGGESFGIVLIEAMACGKPVICSEIDGYKCVINKFGKEGFFESENADSLTATLQKVIFNDKLRIKLSKWSLNEVKRYELEKIVRDIENYYNKFVD